MGGQETVDRNLKKRREVQTGYKEKLFPQEGSEAVEQVAQQGCAASVLEGFQDLAGQSHEQPGLPSREILFLTSSGPLQLNLCMIP